MRRLIERSETRLPNTPFETVYEGNEIVDYYQGRLSARELGTDRAIIIQRANGDVVTRVVTGHVPDSQR